MSAKPYSIRPGWALDLEAWDFAETGRADEARKMLARLMSDISEECWCAGWLTGNEGHLWRFAETLEPSEYGMGSVQPDEIRALRALASLAGGWVEWGPVSEGSPCLLDDDTEGDGCVFMPWQALGADDEG